MRKLDGRRTSTNYTDLRTSNPRLRNLFNPITEDQQRDYNRHRGPEGGPRPNPRRDTPLPRPNPVREMDDEFQDMADRAIEELRRRRPIPSSRPFRTPPPSGGYRH